MKQNWLYIFRCCVALSIIFIVSSKAISRPVSYAGGWTGTTEHDYLSNSMNIHYSPNAKYSLGFRFDYLKGDDAFVESLQINNLLKRWNAKDYQANLYLQSGLGISHNNKTVQPAIYSGVATDWENRRLFLSYSSKVLYSPNITTLWNNRARIGIAPYIAGYGKIHTWLMLQGDYNPLEDGSRRLVLTPLVRFFKGPALVELGVSTEKTIFAKLIYRF